MSQTRYNQEYNYTDVEDQAVEEETCMPQDANMDMDDFDYNYEYTCPDDCEETKDPDATQPCYDETWEDQADLDEMVYAKPAPQATEAEMAEALVEFNKLLKADREAAEEAAYNKELSTSHDELQAWCDSVGISIVGMPGTFWEKVVEMRFQKACAAEEKAKKDAVEAKIAADAQEQQRLERIAEGKAALAKVQENAAKAAKARAIAKTQKPNAKGKLQGDKTGVTKRARNAAKKVAETRLAAAKAAVPITVVPKAVVVPMIPLTANANSKSKAKGSAAETRLDLTVEVEEAETYIFSTKEQHLEIAPKKVEAKVEAKVDTKPLDDGFTVVGSKKPKVPTSKPLTADEITKCLFQFNTEEPMHTSKAGSSKPSSPTEAARQAGFAMLASTTAQQAMLTCTRMCNSVGTGKPCHHGSKCRFAHTFEQLNKKRCVFSNSEGHACRYAIPAGPGVYKNKTGHTGKICQCWHQDETNESYASRMGIKLPTQSKPVVAEPVKLQLKPAPAPVTTPTAAPIVKLAPWAPIKPVERPATDARPAPRKSRWDEQATKVAPVAPVAPTSTPTSTTVIRVPKCLQEATLQMCLNKGMTNFQIILTD
jgi:hypothetical protein